MLAKVLFLFGALVVTNAQKVSFRADRCVIDIRERTLCNGDPRVDYVGAAFTHN